jgi:hypothetical protein
MPVKDNRTSTDSAAGAATSGQNVRPRGEATVAINALDLRKGMTVYREARGGQWKIDFKVGDYFTTSGPDRLQPLAFHTTNGVKIFAHCATVRVGTGRKNVKTVEAGRSERDKRRNRKGKVGVR